MDRPTFHYCPEKNWINDPNGLCQVDGWYHLYYQYNPHGSVWGDMHWGHARSRDMLTWETLPVAMAPEEAAGEIHCFSGSCCKDGAGRPHFFYTSIGREDEGRGCVTGAQQWTAEPEGGMNCLAQTARYAILQEIHGGAQVREWRDPYVIPWRGGYLMVLGGCLAGRGCVLAYTSPDLRAWTYRGVVAQADQADNVPWECPNLFELEGKMVLFYSPCAAPRYMVGTLGEDCRFHAEHEGVLDPGGRQGFYAPQAFRDEGGRQILLGWMPETDGEAADIRKGWAGAMSLPRILHLSAEGDLRAALWPELAARLEQAGPVGNGAALVHGMVRMRWTPKETPLRITLLATPDGAEATVLTLDAKGMLTLERGKASLDAEAGREAIARQVPMDADEADVLLVVDASVVECCVNGAWLSGRVYPTRADAAGLVIHDEGARGSARILHVK